MDARKAIQRIKEELESHANCEPRDEYCSFYGDVDDIINEYEQNNGN